MPSTQETTLRGSITHVFGHRFVVQTEQKSVLADLTPKGADQIELRIGDKVEISGDQKPTELKVSKVTRDGKTVSIEHGPKHGHHGDADPAVALRSAADAGYTTTGEPRRKPKHFEILAQKNGSYVELHVEFDGHIRKTKQADRTDSKWTAV